MAVTFKTSSNIDVKFGNPIQFFKFGKTITAKAAFVEYRNGTPFRALGKNFSVNALSRMKFGNGKKPKRLDRKKPKQLNVDCWSNVLSLLDVKPRIDVARTNREIYATLPSSYRGQSINLRATKVTDTGLEHLRNVNDINLGFCYDITDSGMVHLSNVKKIDLANTSITDTGLSYLESVENIKLGCCYDITDAGMEHLSNVKEIDLSCCDITDAGMEHLKSVEKLNLYGCDNITSDARNVLKNRGVTIIG